MHLIDGLRALGFDVVHRGWGRPGPRRWIGTPADVTPGDGERAPVGGLAWSDPRTWVRVGLEARRHDPVVVVWLTPLQAPALAVVAWLAGRERCVAIVHNGTPHERGPFDRTLTRLGLRRVGRVVAHAASVLDDLRRQGITAVGSVAPFPPQARLSPSPMPAPPLRLLLFGESARAYKGVDVLLEALATLRSREIPVRLTIAGGVRDTGALAARIDGAGLGDVVELRRGWVPDEDLQALFADHHLVVLPYRSATASGVVPLAHAAGRPVVATAVGGLAEAVRDGIDGVLCPPDDPAALAAALLTAWEARDRLAHGIPSPPPSWVEVAALVAGVGEPRSNAGSVGAS